MTNKLVVIINSLKVPKIKKILLYEMKFLVQNYSCPQNPWLGGYRIQIPVLSLLCPQLNLLNTLEQNSWVSHCMGLVFLIVSLYIETGTDFTTPSFFVSLSRIFKLSVLGFVKAGCRISESLPSHRQTEVPFSTFQSPDSLSLSVLLFN